jgi:small subunit ribosomal protein S15
MQLMQGLHAMIRAVAGPDALCATAFCWWPPNQPHVHRLPSACSARYRGHGTDLAKVPQFERHGKDSGSPEVQVARLSARVLQLTEHLQEHKKDYASRRGLLAVLSQRKQMLIYLQVPCCCCCCSSCCTCCIGRVRGAG